MKYIQKNSSSNNFANQYFYCFLDGIELLVDGNQYGSITPGSGFYEIARQNAVPHASNWLRGKIMAPFDQMVKYFDILLLSSFRTNASLSSIQTLRSEAQPKDAT